MIDIYYIYFFPFYRVPLSSIKTSIFFHFLFFLPFIILSHEKFLFDKHFIKIVLKIFLSKLYNEVMRKNYVRSCPGNIIMHVH